MTNLRETVVLAFIEAGWRFEDDGEGIRIRFKGTNVVFDCSVDIKRGSTPDNSECGLLYLVIDLPALVPEEHRSAVGDYLHRQNYGLIIGSFEIGLEKGHVRFKVGVDGDGGAISIKTVKNLVVHGFTMKEKHYEKLMRIMYGPLKDVPGMSVDGRRAKGPWVEASWGKQALQDYERYPYLLN
jgi:hypothetical protein